MPRISSVLIGFLLVFVLLFAATVPMSAQGVPTPTRQVQPTAQATPKPSDVPVQPTSVLPPVPGVPTVDPHLINTAIPPTAVPPTSVPPTSVPPTQVPPTQVPPTVTPGPGTPTATPGSGTPTATGTITATATVTTTVQLPVSGGGNYLRVTPVAPVVVNDETAATLLDPTDLVPNPAKQVETVVQVIKSGDTPTAIEWAVSWVVVLGGFYILPGILLLGAAVLGTLATLKWRNVI